MTIVPDDKDWTWVLTRPCPECGYESASVTREGVSDAVMATAHSLFVLLDDERCRERPDAATWSGLEYACHVRDVYRLYLYRLGLMLADDGVHFPNWDQDATAVDDDYGSQDPAVVGPEMLAAAQALAEAFARVGRDDWSRRGVRSDGAEFTIDTFARYMLHDPVHHLHDVEQGYAAITRA